MRKKSLNQLLVLIFDHGMNMKIWFKIIYYLFIDSIFNFLKGLLLQKPLPIKATILKIFCGLYFILRRLSHVVKKK
ncbi:hypothetical protein GLOIN_2v1640408 [Rhizophagus irregularis DAOM 181602=DAOM 197198]|uniref:Uncharacterized protein n=1 Tax=Rhizophagus irregularis (strain DAOM 181602 / DAOM 197198 / MUCL 43194) TaxID=747089 RepID=A0A2P4PRW4_RHIID|nr:hypothetical protein GLOIN_2v1640408 [Rhizophagus irregularis DAOM 181602=DAOM 197198]POG68113.1 hypothetical protein GLOIN_2v1640408 [Rhizophagus irregularis DAOM 181602=DAOM 197198]GET61681.1 hypothetical protein GLOIN_2v1640408 [Rhizophagus irregularis DAOM 181602=DAOM 197198]|eukprot:XP_025174979.1 hypothetical protein GLOIN_2v1640408 [Rhizophagus irregularis DAOM 181602=DAOM 197198]